MDERSTAVKIVLYSFSFIHCNGRIIFSGHLLTLLLRLTTHFFAAFPIKMAISGVYISCTYILHADD